MFTALYGWASGIRVVRMTVRALIAVVNLFLFHYWYPLKPGGVEPGCPGRICLPLLRSTLWLASYFPGEEDWEPSCAGFEVPGEGKEGCILITLELKSSSAIVIRPSKTCR
jgi:hypothetical protein